MGALQTGHGMVGSMFMFFTWGQSFEITRCENEIKTGVKLDRDTYMDVGGTTPWMEEVESRLEQRSRKCREHIFETRLDNFIGNEIGRMKCARRAETRDGLSQLATPLTISREFHKTDSPVII